MNSKMKLSMIALMAGMLISTASQAFAGCPKLDISGVWHNQYGFRFTIKQLDCKHIIISDQSHHRTFGARHG